MMFLCCSVGVANAKLVNSDDEIEHCSMVAKFARTAMKARQGGLPLSDHLETLLLIKRVDENFYDIAKIIAIDAYKIPKWEAPTNQDNEINDFSNRYNLACLEFFLTRDDGK